MYILTQGPTTTRVLGGYGYPGKLLWRAVNQDGEIVDVFLQNRRDGVAAKRFFKRLSKKHRDEPRKIVTDKLRSYGVAHRELIPDTIHDTSQYANNRAELSHQPTRVRERACVDSNRLFKPENDVRTPRRMTTAARDFSPNPNSYLSSSWQSKLREYNSKTTNTRTDKTDKSPIVDTNEVNEIVVFASPEYTASKVFLAWVKSNGTQCTKDQLSWIGSNALSWSKASSSQGVKAIEYYWAQQ
jgi:hypothetical protein